jgi:hypothetical protein
MSQDAERSANPMSSDEARRIAAKYGEASGFVVQGSIWETNLADWCLGIVAS